MPPRLAYGCSRRGLLRSAACLGGLYLARPIRLHASSIPPSGRETWIPGPEIRDQIPSLMAARALPGLSITVVEQGVEAWSEFFGVANVQTGEPVTAWSMFEAASLSKPLFAYGVMKLVEEGLVDPEEPLAETLYPDDFPDHPFMRRISVRHVLEHTSGLPNWRGEIGGDLTPRFEPGTEWRYSGEAFFWLQRVVEMRVGDGLDAVMQRLVLGPAGMTQSTFSWTPARARWQVHGHRIDSETGASYVAALQLRRELGPRFAEVAERWGKPIPNWTYGDVCRALAEMRPHDNPQVAGLPLGAIQLPGNVFPNAAGSLATTTQDYARFVRLMFPSEVRADWQVSERTREVMLRTAVTKSTPGLSWGLGWGLEDAGDVRIFYHAGNNGGMFHSFVVGDAIRRRAIVIFTNGEGGHHVANSLVGKLTGRSFTSASD